jgi:5-methylcytosine-specific restriction endonuclease McrA
MRKIPPWVGTTDDAKIPLQVQLRILQKQGGRCAITGHKFVPGNEKHLDHKIPIADGGMHAEVNLQWILSDEHRAKTSDEASVRAKVRSVAARHAGLERPGKAEIAGPKKKEKPQLRVAAGMPEIMRRFR